MNARICSIRRDAARWICTPFIVLACVLYVLFGVFSIPFMDKVIALKNRLRKN